MSAPRLETRPTIDRTWLERAARDEPLTHAYALWDLDRAPQTVRFVSAVRGEETVGYLLVWLGRTDQPVVHWFGPPGLADRLVRELPRPPFVAVVPPAVGPAISAAFPRSPSTPLKMMVRGPGGLPPSEAPVRRLGREDQARLSELLRGPAEPDLSGYVGLDLESEPTWGAFDGERLVGVARAAVRLPRIWVVGGVFVEPDRRDEGLGRGLVSAVVEAAERTGARTGLYVRADPGPAMWLYEGLGFREVGRRLAFDVRPPAGP